MKAVYALSLLAAAASALTFKNDPFWKSYKAMFGKVYSHDREEIRRYILFNENMQKAAKFNADDKTAQYGMTVVSDRFPEEIRMTFDGADYPKVETESVETADTAGFTALPSSFDARTKGWVPAIRNQGGCGSCWAFAAAAVMSIANAKKHGGSPLVLSEQQLVDCSPEDHGCNGGWPARAAKYAKVGIMLNADYPYVGRVGTCAFVSSKAKVKTSDSGRLTQSVSKMKEKLYNNGAIAVVLSADKLQGYQGGIIDETNCAVKIEHAVVAVGWGSTGSQDYWIVRNSWGSYWGESGYFRIVMGKNACGVESWSEYIEVV